MSRSSYPGGSSQKSVFASLLAPVVAVAIVGVLGLILLWTLKWLVVALLIAIGIGLIIAPFLMGRRIIGASVGSERAGRIAQLGTAVVLGIALIAIAIVVRHHGWLLIVVPVVVVLIGRLWGRFSASRAARRDRQFH